MALITNLVVFSTLMLSVWSQKPTIVVTPSLDSGPINWKTDVTIECTWEVPTDAPSPPAGDLTVDEDSIWRHPDYSAMIKAYDSTERVYAEDDSANGRLTITIKDIGKADEHTFQCNVPRGGVSTAVDLSVLEPPSDQVANLVAVPDFEAVTITYDAVEGATVYTVGIQSDGSATWDEFETSDLTYTFDGLSTATGYTVKVRPGNAAGYRTEADVPFTTDDSVVTKDNRPPVAVDALTADAPGYNISDITLTWSLESNDRTTRIINRIEVVVKSEDALGELTPVLTEDLAGDAVTYSYTAPGAGKYSFTVTPHNDFSVVDGVIGEGLALEVEHEVKETTKPPPTEPKPPTEPPTETPLPQLQCTENPVVIGDDTEDDSADESADDSGDESAADDAGDDVADDTPDDGGDPADDGGDPADDGGDPADNPAEKKRKRRNAYAIVKEVTADEELTLACYLTADAKISSDDIKWSYLMDSSDEEVDEAGMAEYGISFQSDNTSRALIINKASMSHTGIFKCSVGNETCTTDLTVQAKVVDEPESSSSSFFLSTTILSLLALLLLLQ